MKKWNEDNLACGSCIGTNYMGSGRCAAWRNHLSVPEGIFCGDNDHKYYANQEQCKRLLKLWDDANGSIYEWRENASISLTRWDNNDCCDDCMGHRKCTTWAMECGEVTGACYTMAGPMTKPKFFAHRERTEAILKWHDDKHGTIQDRLRNMSIANGRSCVCPYCGGKDYISCPNVSERFRKCVSCGSGYHPEKIKHEADVEDLDFRVGDNVTRVTSIKGKVTGFTSHSVVKVQFKDGSTDVFSKSGSPTLSGERELFHDSKDSLDIYIDEEKPKRVVKRWIFLYKLNNEPVKSSGEFDTKKDCLMERKSYSKCKGYTILSELIEVKIPE